MKTVALFIVFPLLEPFSSSVWKLIEFFVVLVTQPFSLSHLLLWKLFSAGARQSFWGFPNSIFILSAYHHKCGDHVISWANIACISIYWKGDQWNIYICPNDQTRLYHQPETKIYLESFHLETLHIITCLFSGMTVGYLSCPHPSAPSQITLSFPVPLSVEVSGSSLLKGVN